MVDLDSADLLGPGWGKRPIKLLTFTTLFPHAGRPNHGIFVENRLRHLVATGEATSTVIAPVPWFPSKSARFGEWGRNACAGRAENRNGLAVYHPRYALPPRVGMSVAPMSLALTAAVEIRHLVANGLEFDLIDAHFLYPDGVAAVLLGRLLKKPVVITARGSDVTQYPNHALPRSMIKWAAKKAAALITVSNGLKSALVELGTDAAKIRTLRNGVDLDLFRPSRADAAMANHRSSKPSLLSVGHLIARKRHDFAIRSLLELPGWSLAIVGEGPELASLRRLAVQLRLDDRVQFYGAQPHTALAGFYSNADVLVLASTREGWANVLLEAMACGTPVVASNIPGNPEVVTNVVGGEVVAENTPSCFAMTIRRVYERRSSRMSVRAYAEQFGWESTSQGQLALFRSVLGRDRPATGQPSLGVDRDDSS